MQETTETPLFPLGQIVATPGALAARGNEQTGRLPMPSGYGHPVKFCLLTFCEELIVVSLALRSRRGGEPTSKRGR